MRTGNPSLALLGVLLVFLTAGLTSCAGSEETLGAVPVALAPTPSENGRETPGPTVPPATVATPTPEPITPTATPVPTATPLVTVTSFDLAPTTMILFPPAGNAALSLGYDYQGRLTANVSRSDHTRGAVKWLDFSGGQLSVDDNGLVSVAANAAPGFYRVRAQSVDDPNVWRDASVEVRCIGQLDVIIN